jgi:hypothetical protein
MLTVASDVPVCAAHHQEVANMPASGLDQALGFIGSPSWLPTLRELTLCVVLNSPGCASPAALGFFFRQAHGALSGLGVSHDQKCARAALMAENHGRAFLFGNPGNEIWRYVE